MTELEMLEEAVQSEAVEAAPGAVEILPGLGLLSAVVVVQELVNYPGHLRTKSVTWSYIIVHMNSATEVIETPRT